MLEKSYIPHLKALMCGINTLRGQRHGYRFTMCHASLKMALSLRKVGFVKRLMSTTVKQIENILCSKKEEQQSNMYAISSMYFETNEVKE